MTTNARGPINGFGLAAFIVAVCSLVPTLAVTIIGLLVTSASAASHRENPGAVSMISSDFGEWLPIVVASFAFGIPAAATAAGLGIASLRRSPRSRLGGAGVVISAVVIVLGVIGAIVGATQGGM